MVGVGWQLEKAQSLKTSYIIPNSYTAVGSNIKYFCLLRVHGGPKFIIISLYGQ